MEFSEANGKWQPLPTWVEFLIRMGYGWPSGEQGPRRIALVSMPSDSAGAGLVTLGALIRDLKHPRTSDADCHSDHLVEYARQYLDYCRRCRLRCDPSSQGCGFVTEATGRVRSRCGKIYHVSERSDLHTRCLGFERGNITEWPSPTRLVDWHIDGEPPVELPQIEGELPAGRYQALIEGAPITGENLRRTYSGLCLAGRSGGENASLDVCQTVRFRSGSAEFGLASALTIHGWSECQVSRAAFFNVRTERLDRSVGQVRFVVADGDASFLNVIDRAEFRNGDVVGVIHRIMERDRLEAVGNKLSALRQWYVPDEEMLCGLPAVPRGTSVSILRRRT